MAIQGKDGGRYIKIIRDRCEFHPSSVLVCFYEFKSRKDRDIYFNREKDIMNFVNSNFNTFHQNTYDAAEILSKSGVDISKLDSPDKLSKEIQKILDKNSDLISDLQLIRRDWKEPTFARTKFKNKKYLIELGFKEEWFTPIVLPTICTLSTGVFVGQNFSYDCLYKELKKIFKNDFVDC